MDTRRGRRSFLAGGAAGAAALATLDHQPVHAGGRIQAVVAGGEGGRRELACEAVKAALDAETRFPGLDD